MSELPFDSLHELFVYVGQIIEHQHDLSSVFLLKRLPCANQTNPASRSLARRPILDLGHPGLSPFKHLAHLSRLACDGGQGRFWFFVGRLAFGRSGFRSRRTSRAAFAGPSVIFTYHFRRGHELRLYEVVKQKAQ
jgi:hypothetical protein